MPEIAKPNTSRLISAIRSKTRTVSPAFLKIFIVSSLFHEFVMIGGITAVNLVKTNGYFESVVVGNKIKRGIIFGLNSGNRPAGQAGKKKNPENDHQEKSGY